MINQGKAFRHPRAELLNQIAEEYGTPAMVYDEDAIRGRMQDYVSGFKSDRFETHVLYASKVFLCRHMAQIASEEGMCFDAVSGGEVHCLKNAGVSAEKIYFHGNNKTHREIREFSELGRGHIIVDNEDELELIERVSREVSGPMDIIIRINPGVEAHTHKYIATANKDSKFGISSDEAETIAEMIRKMKGSEFLHFSGFHSHIGSQIFQVEAFEKEISVMFDFVKKMVDITGVECEELDLGGGFAIRYLPEDDPPAVEEICRRMIGACERKASETGINIGTLLIEPGRSVVGDFGHTIYSAGCHKKTETVEYVFVDGGMADNIRPALYEAEYFCTNITREDEENTEHYAIAGKCCESGDILIRDALLPKTYPGDLILVYSTGAYGYSMASNYNRHGRPPVIFVSKGKLNLAVRRENYEDMMSLEV